MMKWKLKVDAEGKPVLDANGNFIWIKPDNTEFVGDVEQMFNKIGELTREAAKNRTDKEAAETKLAAFNGIDAKAAKEALDTVGKLKDGELIAAGKVEEVRQQIKQTYETQIADLTAKNTKLGGDLNNTKLGFAFAGSKFIADKLIMPPDLAQASFGKHFEFTEDGKMIAKDAHGNQIYSPTRPGEPADFDEAISSLVNAYPNKNGILKGANNGGSGTDGKGGNDGGKKVYTRADLAKLGAHETAGAMKEVREGKATLTD